MDAAVVTVMGMLGEHEGFASAAVLIAAELELRLGPPARAAAEAEFARRGLDVDGSEVIRSREEVLAHTYMTVQRSGYTVRDGLSSLLAD